MQTLTFTYDKWIRCEGSKHRSQYHELLEHRSDRNEEALPSLHTLAELQTLARREEVAVLAQAEAVTGCMLLQYEIESGDDRERIVITRGWVRVDISRAHAQH
jgi:hypothetical protein